jgi:hypothetical protein
LAIRANHPLFRLSTRRFKIAEPAATGQIRRAMPQDVSRGGHKDVLVPCPENRSLAADRRARWSFKPIVNNVVGIHN